MVALRFESVLAAPADDVWREVSTMQGVNYELMPLMRMSVPAHVAGMSLANAPVGERAFHSWLLLFGVLPIDRHALTFERLYDNGFDERSSSWMQRTWIHRRRVEAVAGGTRVTDELDFEPRFWRHELVLRPVIRALFKHRHRRLRRRFGAQVRNG